MIDKITIRKQAYQYIVGQAKKLNWIPPMDSDQQLAESLDVPMSELNSLKEGLSDPSAELIAAFKSLVSPMVNETEVNSYLVKPFEQQE